MFNDCFKHKNSMNPDQTVRPARPMIPPFGPIAYRIIPDIKNDHKSRLRIDAKIVYFA